jgi:small subunit ribosomal protein S8
MTDQIANALSIIKNGYLARKKIVEIPNTSVLRNIVNVLAGEGYIEPVDVKKEKQERTLMLTLRYEGKKPVLTNIERVSKPGLRFYVGKNQIPRVLGGIGNVIISTSKGVMTGSEAKKQSLGGEIICKVW